LLAWAILALLSVCFLLTYTPSARAAGNTGDPMTSSTPHGGPDDPDDGTLNGNHGDPTHGTLPRAPRVGTPVLVVRPVQGTSPVIGRAIPIPQFGNASLWTSVLKALFLTLRQVR